MKGSIENYRTGWAGVAIGIKNSEIDSLIACLEDLRITRSHFHFRSSFEGESGIADVELFLLDEDVNDNLTLDASQPHFPSICTDPK